MAPVERLPLPIWNCGKQDVKANEEKGVHGVLDCDLSEVH